MSANDSGNGKWASRKSLFEITSHSITEDENKKPREFNSYTASLITDITTFLAKEPRLFHEALIRNLMGCVKQFSIDKKFFVKIVHHGCPQDSNL